MRFLQTTFAEHPGLLVVVANYGDISAAERDRWYVKIWDWNTPHQEYPDQFASRDAAQTWAEREFLIDPAAWEECDAFGGAETIVDVLKRIYPRRLTGAEAAAAAHLCYAYEFVDRQGRPIWPGEERCITSFNVVADVMDALEWDRDFCKLFPTDGRNSYGFVADADHWADAVEASPEFRTMWDSFVAAAGVTGWGPSQVRPAPRSVPIPSGDGLLAAAARAVLEGTRYPQYETGAMGNAFGITHHGHVLLIDSATSIALDASWTDGRALHVAGAGLDLHVLLHRWRPDGGRHSYLTGVDGTLRQAVWRSGDVWPLVVLDIDDERERFGAELDAWLASPPVAARDGHRLLAVDLGEEIDSLIVRVASDAAALREAIALLKTRGVFVAEAMNNAPPHVVRRVVLSALEQMRGTARGEQQA